MSNIIKMNMSRGGEALEHPREDFEIWQERRYSTLLCPRGNRESAS